ncbi:MAG: DUF3703 domain-containing protein [Acidovorax sp.]|nr:MAG: DUF3703 domain-containing protein [Acidovorax sp.]
MRVRLSTPLAAPPEWVAAQLQSTAVFRHITAPLMHFKPAKGTPWPTTWSPGELSLHMRLLGVLPMGPQTVRISIEPALHEGAWPTLRDNGEGALMRVWDHRITLHPLPGGRTLYTDDIEVVARHLPWLMTPLSAAFAQVFYRHRQRRWRALVERYVKEREQTNQEIEATNTPSPLHQSRAFEHLLRGFAQQPQATHAERWHWLEAAHVLGQTSARLHWRSHWAMLGYAHQVRDWREVAGQLGRLALVPLGHLLARLPKGNTGRAHVSAFQPMVPTAEITALIDRALKKAKAG